MSHLPADERTAISADEFLALHRQVAALVSLGLPIERHLAGWNRRQGRRLKRATRQVISSLQKGQTLSEALSQVDKDLAPVYRAVLEAGMASGRPGMALQELTECGQRILGIRNLLLSSLYYPLIVFLVAWAVVILYLLVPFPVLHEVIISWNGESVVFDWLNQARATMHYWGPIGPAVILVLFLFWRFQLRKSKLLIPWRAAWRLGWFPGVRRLIQWQQNVVLSDMLALMTRQGVPLDRAVRLAGAIFADPKMERESGAMADAIAAQDWQRVLEVRGARRIPMSIRLAIVEGVRSGRLEDALMRVWQHWRRQTWRQDVWIRTIAVPLVVVAFGCVCVLIVALTFWWPWLQVMFQMFSFRP